MPKFLKLSKTKQYLDATTSRSESSDCNVPSQSKLDMNLTNSLVKEIQSIVKKEGLMDAYNKLDVSKLPQPISFAFNLVSVSIYNFKSIESYTLDFKDMKALKTILISGRNGSGKSSILQAIYLGLKGYRFISRYNRLDSIGRSFPCRIEVTLYYLDRYYKIVRGDGLLQFFSSSDNVVYSEVDAGKKSNLDAYINATLPFIPHLDYLYIGANEHYFNKIDRVGLIKTCFNLDILFHIYDEARSNVNALKKSIDECQSFINKSDTSIELYNNELSKLELELNQCIERIPINTLTCNPYTRDEVLKELSNIDSIVNSIDVTSRLINVSKSRINSIDSMVKDSGNIDMNSVSNMKSLLNNVATYNKSITELNSKLKDYIHSYEMYLDRLSYMKSSIKKCPNCGIDIMDETISDKIDIINQSIAESSEKIKMIQNELVNMKVKATNYMNSLPKIYADILSIDRDTSMLITDSNVPDISYYENLELKYKNVETLELERKNLLQEVSNNESKLTQLELDLNRLLHDIPVSDYKAKLNSCIETLANIDHINRSISSMKVSLDNTLISKSNKEQELVNYASELDSMSKLMKLFDQTNLNSIPYTIIEHIVNTMNTDEIKFRTFKELGNGGLKFDVSCSLKLGEDFYIDYDSASDGQKLIIDLYIIKKLVNLLGNVGLVIMDEALTNLDEVAYATVKYFFRDTNCDKILIVSHNPNIDGYDKELKCRLNDDLLTEVSS